MRALILLLLLLIAPAGVVRLQAQSTTTPAAGFSGLDVTILLDQSDSMWKSPRNDRYAHRIGQSKNLIYRLAEHVEGTPLVHRVSVIEFGDTATVALSNHVMRYDPADPGGALRQTKAIVEGVVIERPLINTNTGDAMRQALLEYAKMDAAQALADRRRVLLIITDGRPYLPGRDLVDLQAAVRSEAQSLKARNVELWIVGINDGSNYWNEGDGAFWESVTGSGHARLAETASSKIFTIMQDIADNWLGSKSAALKGDEYNCPPYLRRIVFSVNMGQPHSAVGVADPDGQDIAPSSGGPSAHPGNFTRFVVDDPKIGVYKIKRDPTRSYSWRVEETAADIKRLSPAKATGLEAPARILFQARDNKDNPLILLDEYPINGVIVITPPGGPPTELKAEYFGDGKFGVSRWQPPALGTYRVRIKGLVKLKDGSEVDVFQSNASSYDEVLAVNNLRAYFLRLENPAAASGFRVMKPASEGELRFVVVDAKGNKVTNLAGLVKDPASWLNLGLVDKSGAPLGGPPLPLSLSADGTFSTQLPMHLDWLHGEGWWSPGRLNIRLSEQSGRIAAGNYLDSIQLSPDEETQRIGGDPLALALMVRFSWIILGVALFIATLIVATLMFLVLRRGLPKGMIWFADRYKRRRVALKIYDADLDPDGSAGKTFSITGGAQFNYDREYIIPVDGRDYIAVRLRVKRAPLVDRVEAGVLYSWDDDPKKSYTVNLRKGKIERLKGLPRSDFAITLDENP